METGLQVFKYKGEQVRTVERDGEVWFVAKDVCDALGLSNARKAVKSLDEDEKNTVTIGYGNRGNPNMTVINEPGLYRLIFKSTKAEAKEFTRWVTHEVLPDIRKHGMYLTDGSASTQASDPEAFEALAKKYVEERKTNRELRERIASDRAFTNLGRVVLALPGAITFQSAAQFLCEHGIPTGQNRLYRKCREKKLLCSRKGKQHNRPTQSSIEQGLFSVELSEGFHAITLVTPKGLSHLLEMLSREEYPLIVMMEALEDD